MSQLALRWILMFDGVTCAIPGAKQPEQADQNITAADLPSLTKQQMQAIETIYDQYIRKFVHQRW